MLASVKGGVELSEAIKAEQEYVKETLEESGKKFVGHERLEESEDFDIAKVVYG